MPHRRSSPATGSRQRCSPAALSRQRSSGDLLADRRYAYAEACLAEGDARAACEMAEQALDLAPRFAPAWFLLGRARERLGATPDLRQAALRAYENALDLDPDDALGARLRLARIGGADGAPAITPAYVRALFDGYAARFDRHLVGALGYRGPAMLVDALDGACGGRAAFAEALDLGCGTGLVGTALGERIGRLAGCDLSPAMLALARGTGRYARLVEADLAAFLAGEPAASADLVAAADVLIYVRDLAPVLAGIARVMRPGALAAFTVQSPPDGETAADGVLGEDGRYAHADAAVAARAGAAGLAVALLRPAAVRRENGRDVPGRVVLLRTA